MSVEDFKHQYATELTGLTAARVTTLWKKSKTMKEDETREAISQSKTAQLRDQQRRSGKITDAPVTHPVDAPVTHPVDAPVTHPRATPDWSNECKQAEIDLDQLNRAVDILCSKMKSRNASCIEMRILKLYQSVEDLLLLRVKSKNTIDVLSVLRAYAL
jgi:hypothetical protein